MPDLSILLLLPLIAGVVGYLVPRKLVSTVAVAGSLATLGLAAWQVSDFERLGLPLQNSEYKEWIGSVGAAYNIGVSGLNVWLVLLTAVAFFIGITWTAYELANLGPGRSHGGAREDLSARARFLLIGIAQSSVFGAFLSHDLLLFVAFFDLMLIPFFILAVAGDPVRRSNRDERVAAVTKMVIYTLVGSLLMLAAAVAVAVLARPDGEGLTFSLAKLSAAGVPEKSQTWLFALFALAFLVKMPAVPFHGWMRDGYKAMPLPMLAVFSAVLSKVAAFGFLAVALPLLPHGAANLRPVMVVIAIVSIIYASFLAFTTKNARLILGYSSIAQLGFILLGIFSLRPDGAAGSLLQMINHGLVVLPALVAVAVLSARAHGSEEIDDMGGVAVKAPIFAVLFVITAYALLAIPGSANFIGELMILRGAWEMSPVAAIIASLGVALAAVYALRLFIRTTHGKVGPAIRGRELSQAELFLMAVPVAALIALGVAPQRTAKDGEALSAACVRNAAADAEQSQDGAYSHATYRAIASASSHSDMTVGAHQCTQTAAKTKSTGLEKGHK